MKLNVRCKVYELNVYLKGYYLNTEFYSRRDLAFDRLNDLQSMGCIVDIQEIIK